MRLTQFNMNATLLNNNQKKYGAQYRQHLFEQYKLYIEGADKISDRRQAANNYFITINTLLISFVGVATTSNTIPVNKVWQVLILSVGIIICYIWYKIINSYKQLNTGKFHLIHEIEGYLPLNIYKHEWAVLKEGKDKKAYNPFSHIELHIPKIFSLVYILLILFLLFS